MTNKQSELLNYFTVELSRLDARSKQLASLPQPQGKSQSTFEIQFLLQLKAKLKELQQALAEERCEKQRLQKIVQNMSKTSHTKQPTLSKEDWRKLDTELKTAKAASMANPFFSSEERPRLTFIEKDKITEGMIKEGIHLPLTPRKSFDDIESKCEDKHSEKFWQNQVQRVIQQNKNYKHLYKENKRIREKHEHALK